MPDVISSFDERALVEYFNNYLMPSKSKRLLKQFGDLAREIEPPKAIRSPLLQKFRRFFYKSWERSCYEWAALRWLNPQPPHLCLEDLPWLQSHVRLDHIDMAAFLLTLHEQCHNLYRDHSRLGLWIHRRCALLQFEIDPASDSSKEDRLVEALLRRGLFQAIAHYWAGRVLFAEAGQAEAESAGELGANREATATQEWQTAEDVANTVSQLALDSAARAVCTILGGGAPSRPTANLMVPVRTRMVLDGCALAPGDAIAQARQQTARQLWGADAEKALRSLLVVSETLEPAHPYKGFWAPVLGEGEGTFPGAPLAYQTHRGATVFKNELPQIVGFDDALVARWKHYMTQEFRDGLFVSLPLLMPKGVTLGSLGECPVAAAVLNVNANPAAGDIYWRRAHHLPWLEEARNGVAPYVEIAYWAFLIKNEVCRARRASMKISIALDIDTGDSLWSGLPMPIPPAPRLKTSQEGRQSLESVQKSVRATDSRPVQKTERGHSTVLTTGVAGRHIVLFIRVLGLQEDASDLIAARVQILDETVSGIAKKVDGAKVLPSPVGAALVLPPRARTCLDAARAIIAEHTAKGAKIAIGGDIGRVDGVEDPLGYWNAAARAINYAARVAHSEYTKYGWGLSPALRKFMVNSLQDCREGFFSLPIPDKIKESELLVCCALRHEYYQQPEEWPKLAASKEEDAEDHVIVLWDIEKYSQLPDDRLAEHAELLNGAVGSALKELGLEPGRGWWYGHAGDGGYIILPRIEPWLGLTFASNLRERFRDTVGSWKIPVRYGSHIGPLIRRQSGGVPVGTAIFEADEISGGATVGGILMSEEFWGSLDIEVRRKYEATVLCKDVKRSKTMVDFALSLQSKTPGSPIALIVGAAHTEKIVELLRAAGVSFAQLTPVALNPDFATLSEEQFDRKDRQKWVRTSVGSLGHLLYAQRKPPPIIGLATAKSYASLNLAALLVARATRAGRPVPEAIWSEIGGLPELRIDRDSFAREGNDTIFRAWARDTNNQQKEIWIRVAALDTPEEAKTVEEKLFQAIADLGGGGRVSPRDPPANSSRAEDEGPGDGTREGVILNRIGPREVAVFAASQGDAKRVRISG